MRWFSAILLVLLLNATTQAKDKSRTGEIGHEASCDIKGNLGRKKLRLYFLPDHPTYSRVKINKRGERWFCTEKKAKAAGWKKAGTWRRGKASPEDFRDCLASTQDHPPGCDIKGNISRSGQIYHVRGSKYYFETEVREELGERWFCSEVEAEAAGWRKPRNQVRAQSCKIASTNSP